MALGGGALSSIQQRNDCPIFNINSTTAPYLKQHYTVLDSTLNKNLTKSTSTGKQHQDKYDQQLREKQILIQNKMKEAEDKRRELVRLKNAQFEKLKQLDKDEAVQIAKLDSEIKNSQQRQKQLEDEGAADFEYVGYFGNFITTSMKLSWKKEAGKVFCPEGKILHSDSETVSPECDFWSCPSISPPSTST